MHAVARLGGLAFRINPSAIDWNFQIKTSVEDTIGGRVVQVIGATLSDITITGEYGQVMGQKGLKGRERGAVERDQDPGLSWRLAEEFVHQVRHLMDEQSHDSRKGTLMNEPLLFEFPDYGWRFRVYVKSISSGSSENAIDHTVGNFAYKYRLVLFVVDDVSDNLTRAGTSLQDTKGVVNKKRNQAIEGYIARISRGVGWAKSEYNDPSLNRDPVTGRLNYTPYTEKTDTGPGTAPLTESGSNTVIAAPYTGVQP